jgi:hypothetical protein
MKARLVVIVIAVVIAVAVMWYMTGPKTYTGDEVPPTPGGASSSPSGPQEDRSAEMPKGPALTAWEAAKPEATKWDAQARLASVKPLGESSWTPEGNEGGWAITLESGDKQRTIAFYFSTGGMAKGVMQGPASAAGTGGPVIAPDLWKIDSSAACAKAMEQAKAKYPDFKGGCRAELSVPEAGKPVWTVEYSDKKGAQAPDAKSGTVKVDGISGEVLPE